MRNCNLTIREFSLTIGNNALKVVYNLLISLFTNQIRAYLETQLNDALQEHSAVLLKWINNATQQSLPVLQKMLMKADALLVKQQAEQKKRLQQLQEQDAAPKAQPAVRQLDTEQKRHGKESK